MRHVQMLLKPASGLCGLRCRYCFYHDETAKREQASYGIMEEAVLEAVIQRALASATQSCTFSFQGGEPTLAGLVFFRRAVELARQYNKNRVQVCFSLQTNGMDLTPAWADFLAENHFLVGLSLDGVKETHDANPGHPPGGGHLPAGAAGRPAAGEPWGGVQHPHRGEPPDRAPGGAYLPFLPAQPPGLPAVSSPVWTPWGRPRGSRTTPSPPRSTAGSCAACSICGTRTR